MKLKRAVNNINDLIRSEVIKELERKVPKAKELLLSYYDDLYDYMLYDGNSKADPGLFKERFEIALDSFNFLSTDGELKFVTPDMENFDFTGLDTIRMLFEGIPGEYLEISHSDYDILNVEYPVYIINDLDAEGELFCIIEKNDYVMDLIRNVLNKPPILFPFSDVPPLYDVVFGKLDDYITENLDSWVNAVVDRCTKEVNQKYRKLDLE
jgi:hypothetical protein